MPADIPILDLPSVRAHFPSLSSGFIFADNAGGSQTAKGVVDRISDYLLHTNVQLGADYSVSVQSTQRVADGSIDAAELFNAANPDEVVLGSSSTMVLENLSRAMESSIKPGDEFIITGEHEANGGPWKKLAARRGAIVKYWHTTPLPASELNPYAVGLQLEALLPLITSRTRILALTACSNILGSIVPVEEIVKAARAAAKERGASKLEVSVDCVAYAPHRRIDVQAWDVDFCVFSLYKVYGPHVSALYVRAASLHPLTSIAHHFLKVDTKPYKLQPGGPGYELAYGVTGVLPYLLSLTTVGSLDATYDAIAAHEQTLLQPLLAFLTDKERTERGVKVVGEEKAGLSRVPTVSFVVDGQRPIKSRDIVKVFDQKGGIGIRYGHFYAYTLVDNLKPKLDTDDGVVRISLVHYNTGQEVARIIEILKEVLA